MEGGDPRHQSEWTSVLYRKNVVMALYPLPEDVPDLVIGVLPEGEWTFAANAIFGRTGTTWSYAGGAGSALLSKRWALRMPSGWALPN
ncbi:hypothetical protein EHV15_30700 [Paenibacillus oralis]|uniref:Uncharacterized protein n=1 Tax=Paenibacillus oralis TaxID=2490856 RepID=A0A3P3U8Y3_9BACL|nr:hypothetical protein [Paenibacillus oralis]RRJ66811.1 hypothetical protein EHV15_30700 [Paenibacillus oralis]